MDCKGDLAHKSAECARRLRLWERANAMLFSAILRILDQSEIQSKNVVKNVESGFEAEMTAAAEKISGLEKIEMAIANAADLVKPLNFEPQTTDKRSAGPGLEELLRIITKFQKSNQKRVVDFFE
jgi:hypothetical protein